MQLVTGMRVTLGFESGQTCVASIRDVTAESIDVDLLDDPGAELDDSGPINVFVPAPDGLHYWPATAGALAERSVSLTFIGIRRVTQRRSYPRHAVDLNGRVRRVGQGHRTPPQEVDIIDLSRGGAKVVGRARATTGDRVILEVELATGPVEADARVVMTYPDGHGRRVSHLAFTRIEEPTPGIRSIARYLTTLAVQASAMTESAST